MISPPRRIALIDSGVGGLTVLRALQKALPNESFLYVADTANYPYGTKSQEEILACTSEIVERLSLLPVKLILFACHTASTIALPYLNSPIPLLGIVEPTLSLMNPNQKIALFGTNATIKSGVYQKRAKELFPSSTFYEVQGSPLVTAIEERFSPAAMQATIKKLFSTLPLEELESILLVCTHFPLALEEMRLCFSKNIALLDPAAACALQVEQKLKELSLLAEEKNSPPLFYTTGNPERFLQIAPHFDSNVYSTNFLQKDDEIILKWC